MRHFLTCAAAAVCACLLLSGHPQMTVYASEYTVSGEDNTATEAEVSNSTDSATEPASPAGTTSKRISIKKCTISLSKTAYTYNGKEKKPSVTVTCDSQKLKKNKDYEVSYSDNVDIGTASVTITGINGYKGSVTKTYQIRPKTVSSVSASVVGRQMVVTWKKVSSADGYILYRRLKGTDTWEKLKTVSASSKRRYTDASCTAGKTYEYAVRTYKKTDSGKIRSDYSQTASCTFRPEAPVITQMMTLSKTSCSLSWNLVDGADGYLIYRKVNGSWKKVATVAAYATNHCTITGLTYNKSYTFAVRAYWKAADGTIQRGSLSDSYKEKLSYKKTYANGYRLYYDASGDLITDVEGIIGSQETYTIQVNRTTNTVTVYAQDPDRKDCTIPVKTFLCSTGKATPAGSFKTSEKYRWHALIHNVYGQWSTRITGSILFHSVYYGTNKDANSLDVVEFNKLGTAASAGCVRLNCADVKWIYDNCSTRTKVTIYDSTDPGPFGIPDQLLLDDDHTWDPTDPEINYLCAENGCHQE